MLQYPITKYFPVIFGSSLTGHPTVRIVRINFDWLLHTKDRNLYWINCSKGMQLWIKTLYHYNALTLLLFWEVTVATFSFPGNLFKNTVQLPNFNTIDQYYYTLQGLSYCWSFIITWIFNYNGPSCTPHYTSKPHVLTVKGIFLWHCTCCFNSCSSVSAWRRRTAFSWVCLTNSLSSFSKTCDNDDDMIIIIGWAGFCDIQNNQSRGKCYQLSLKAKADNTYWVCYSGYHKNRMYTIIIIVL